jgi:hypothetical protein
VPPVSLSDLQALARRRAGDTHDAYSEAALARAYEEHRARRREAIAPFKFTVGGRSYDSMFAAIDDPEATFWDAELTLVDPPPAGRAWDWTLPFSRLIFAPDGSAEIQPVGDGGVPQRAIVRLLRRDYFVPRGEAASDPVRPATRPGDRPGLLPLAPTIQSVRQARFIPFDVALLLYGSEERYRLELDLIDSLLLKDPRAGQLPLSRRVRRTARVSHEVDEYLARGELSMQNARVLEILIESHGITPFEVSQIFGNVREFGASALQTLAARGLASLERRTGVFRPRFDGFRPRRETREAEASSYAPLPNPALRTSVMELLAAADSRATCPLCGDPLPPGHRGILCDRCQAEVVASESSPQ